MLKKLLERKKQKQLNLVFSKDSYKYLAIVHLSEKESNIVVVNSSQQSITYFLQEMSLDQVQNVFNSLKLNKEEASNLKVILESLLTKPRAIIKHSLVKKFLFFKKLETEVVEEKDYSLWVDTFLEALEKSEYIYGL